VTITEPIRESKLADREREIFTHQLRAACSKARLNADALQTIAAQLRHRYIDVGQAITAIHEQGLDQYLGQLKGGDL
jgi:hypothetical protein